MAMYNPTNYEDSVISLPGNLSEAVSFGVIGFQQFKKLMDYNNVNKADMKNFMKKKSK